MKEKLIYILLALFIFITFKELNRHNVNKLKANKVIELQKEGKVVEDTKMYSYLDPIHFDIVEVLKSSFPLILSFVIYFGLITDTRFKNHFTKWVFILLVSYFTVLMWNYLVEGYLYYINGLSWLFLILALDRFRKGKFLLSSILSIVWLNWWFYISGEYYMDPEHSTSFHYLYDLYFIKGSLFTQIYDFVPTILGTLLVILWMTSKKLFKL